MSLFFFSGSPPAIQRKRINEKYLRWYFHFRQLLVGAVFVLFAHKRSNLSSHPSGALNIDAVWAWPASRRLLRSAEIESRDAVGFIFASFQVPLFWKRAIFFSKLAPILTPVALERTRAVWWSSLFEIGANLKKSCRTCKSAYFLIELIFWNFAPF